MLRRARPRQLIVVHQADVVVAQEELAARGPIQAPQHIQQRALAGARRAHDRHVVSLRHIERHAAQRVDRFALEHVVFCQIHQTGRNCHAEYSSKRGALYSTLRKGRTVTSGKKQSQILSPKSPPPAAAPGRTSR